MNDESLPSWTQCEARPPRFDVAQTWYLAGRAAALAETKPLRTTLRVWQTLGSLAACIAVWAWIPAVQRLDGDSMVRVEHERKNAVAASVNHDPEPMEFVVSPFLAVNRAADLQDTEFISLRNRTIMRRRNEEASDESETSAANALRWNSREELERSSL